MKILHIITNTDLGGAQKVCIDLCRSAVAERHKVAVASMSGGYLWDQLPEQVRQYRLKNMVKPVNIKEDFRVFFELKKVKKDFKPDIIQLHSSKAGVLGRLVGLGMSKRVVYTVHGFDSIRLKHRFFLPLERVLQYFCGGIVAVSEYDNKNLHSEKIHRNVRTIYNGISEQSIEPEEKFPYDFGGRKIVLTIARIFPPKKIQLFMDVARTFDPKKYAFVWIGGDPNHSLDEIRDIYNAPENVYLMGDIKEASRFINASDLFVLFSNYEGLPMVIIEAMSQKKAVVASDVGGIGELVDNLNGKVIENIVSEASNAISTILENECLRKSMEKNSYQKFKENFTLKKMWNSYKALYFQLLNT